MGYMRLEMGKNLLGIEGEIAWATPGSFTVMNFPCYENGENCVKQQTYVDPSSDLVKMERRLDSHRTAERGNIRG
jgi:cathepsin X